MLDSGNIKLVSELRAGKTPLPETEEPADLEDFVNKIRVEFDRGAALRVAAGVGFEPWLLNGRLLGEKQFPDAIRSDTAILYCHGGAFLGGSPAGYRHLTSLIARTAQANLYSLDYPLSPENPYPAALLHAIDGYRALLAHGFESRNIILAGDSAGGGLAASLLLRIRDEKLPMPAGIALISPSLDLTVTSETFLTHRDRDPWISRELAELSATLYTAGAPRNDPGCSPLYGILAELPPILIHVGSEEVMLGDSLEFTRRVAVAGGDVRLEIWGDMVHVWHFFHPHLRTAGAKAIEALGTWMFDRLNASRPVR